MGLVWLQCVKYNHRFNIALYYLTFTSCFMRFLAFTDVAVFNHGGLVAVQSSDLPLRFLSTFSLSFHTPELSGAAGVYTADGCLAFTSHLRDRKNSAICDPQCSISGATQTEQGIDARAQPRFLTIPLNPLFPLPGPSKSAQCFIYLMEEGNKEPGTTEYPFCFLKKSAVIENEGRDDGDSHMSLRKNYKSQQARWWKRTSCPWFCRSDPVVLIMKSQNNEE